MCNNHQIDSSPKSWQKKVKTIICNWLSTWKWNWWWKNWI